MTGRGLEGRRQARILLVAGFLPVVFEFLALVVFAPVTMGGMLGEPEGSWGSWLLPAIFAAQGLALAWMIRLYPRDAEAHPSAWRFGRL